MADSTPPKIIKNVRSCAACGNATLDQLSGEDDWDMLTMNKPDLNYRCSTCGTEKAVWNKGSIAVVLLVGAAMLASNLSSDGAFSLFAYIAANPAAVMKDVLADGVAGVAGFVVYTVIFGALFIMLPLLILAYAGQNLYWRWRNQKTNLAEETIAVEGTVATPEPERRSWSWWLSWHTISRAMLIGFVAEVSFVIVMHAAKSFSSIDVIAAVLTGGLWWFLMTKKTLWEVPLWLVMLFFFLFLLPTSMFVEIVLLGRYS